MSKTEEILQGLNLLRQEFRAFNDIIIPAIEKVMDDKLKPVMDETSSLRLKVESLQKKLDEHLKNHK